VHDPSVHDDGVTAELAGVLGRPGRAPTTHAGTGVDEHGARRVHPPQRCAADTQGLVDPPFGVHENEPRPTQVPGHSGEPVGWAEPEQHETHRRVAVLLVHLDQVLLTGQSMPVSEQHHDVHPAQRPEVTGVSARRVGDDEPAQ
jgi:hypothetical protein